MQSAADRRSGVHRSLGAAVCTVALLGGWLGAAPALAVELPFLIELHERGIAVRYTPGALDRASRVRDRFELLVAELAVRGGPRYGIVVNLLSREEWEGAGIEVPYGLPAFLGPQEVALAAWGDAGTVALWERLAPGGVPRLRGTPVRGTRAEAESLSALDLVAQVEVARMLAPGLGVSAASDWWEPLAAHTLAGSAFLRYEAARAAEIARFFEALDRGVVDPTDRGGGVAERVVDAARFAAAANAIAEAEGKPPAKPFLKWWRKVGTKHAGELEARLRSRYPKLAAWLDAGNA